MRLGERVYLYIDNKPEIGVVVESHDGLSNLKVYLQSTSAVVETDTYLTVFVDVGDRNTELDELAAKISNVLLRVQEAAEFAYRHRDHIIPRDVMKRDQLDAPLNKLNAEVDKYRNLIGRERFILDMMVNVSRGR